LKAKNLLDPGKMRDTWHWVIAFDAWDYCDPEPLSVLIAEEQIPEEYIHIIVDIVSGKRKPNKKAASKLKVPARERMRIATSISVELGMIDVSKYDAIHPEGKGVVGIGAKLGLEPIEVLRKLERHARDIVQHYCKEFNVSQETIENLLRELRKKMEIWPFV
jgi:hypothetical protein